MFHQGALGDLLLSLPALYSLRVHQGGRPWTLVGNPRNLMLLQHRFYAQEVRSAHQKEWADLYLESPVFPERLRTWLRPFETAYIFAPRRPEVFIRNLERVGLIRVEWLPSFPDLSRGRSIPLVQREGLARLGIPWIQPEGLLFPSDRDRQEAAEVLKKIGLTGSRTPPLLAVHPGSGSRKKNWPLENFLSLAGRLQREKGFQPFFMLGPVEEEIRPGSAGLIGGRGFPVIRGIPLTVLAGVLSRAAAYLGNNSGITHLASSLNLPTLALYGPTDPRLWGPVGRKTVIVRAEGPAPLDSIKGSTGPRDDPQGGDLTVPRVFQVFSESLSIPR